MKINLPKMYRCYRILGWDFTITPARTVLLAFTAFMAGIVLVRLLTGFQYVTHLTDETPWGLWISFDVLCGVALAGGGYSTALLVGGFKYQKYTPVARSALLTSLLGYLLVMGGLFLDIGLWPHFWRPFVSWGYTSVLFEVFWCISIYTTILTIEFHEVITERMFKFLHPYILKALPVLVIIGLIFPMMHQSSLGGLFLIAKSKMFPLWWSPVLPLYFLMSSFFVGSAMVCVESDLARRNYHHVVDPNMMVQLTRVGGRIMIVYLLLKLFDITRQGQWHLVFQGSMQSNLYLLEMIGGIIIPLFIIFSPLAHRKYGTLVYSWLVVLGVVLNRMNCVFTAMYQSGNYFPSVFEFAVSIGLVSAGCLAYGIIVENFNVLGPHRATQYHIQHKTDLL
ncbi:MAG: Polysulfide reductase NrfD [Mitsuokella multacida]|jgi:Ni/Fe-hydrogenase subunit HybB-like protein